MRGDDPFRRALEAAIHDVRKPLADLTADEVVVLYDRALTYFLVHARIQGRKGIIQRG